VHRIRLRDRSLALPRLAHAAVSPARAAVLLACVCVCAGVCLPATAGAAQTASLAATLTPEHLGRGTTIGFSLRVATAAGKVPPPLTEVDLRYPQDLGIATSGLGLATCSTAMLEALGPQGCPSDSVMGIGNAVAEIPVGPEIVYESAPVTIFRAPTENGQIGLLLYANGAYPVDAQLVLPSLLLSATAPFGGLVHIGVPLVPSLPDSPDVAVVQLTTTLGPLGITYYEREHGRTIGYQPRGLQLPDRCPRGGFPFAAELSFVDGSTTAAHTVVPCPSAQRHRRAPGPQGKRSAIPRQR
jgi:hypothetical protein